MNYLVSIILPIYNGEKNLNQLFNSLYNQTINFENLELIFINNVSTDNSLSILNKLSNKYDNVKLINLKKHYHTPGHSRNIGITEASAEYVMFCDGDDYYTSDFCKVMYDTIKRENVELISTRYTVKNGFQKSFLNNSFLSTYNSVIKLNSIIEFPEIIQTQANLTVWNKIYKKDFILENNIQFVEDHWTEDFLFSLECYIKAKGILLLTDYSGYIYNRCDESHTNSQPSKEDYFNNALLSFSKAETLLKNNDFEVMPYISELIVFWIKHLLESDLSNNELIEIYNGFKPWLRRYSIKTKLVNIPTYLNLFINIGVKIFSYNKNTFFLSKKVYQRYLMKIFIK